MPYRFTDPSSRVCYFMRLPADPYLCPSSLSSFIRPTLLNLAALLFPYSRDEAQPMDVPTKPPSALPDTFSSRMPPTPPGRLLCHPLIHRLLLLPPVRSYALPLILSSSSSGGQIRPSLRDTVTRTWRSRSRRITAIPQSTKQIPRGRSNIRRPAHDTRSVPLVIIVSTRQMVGIARSDRCASGRVAWPDVAVHRSARTLLLS